MLNMPYKHYQNIFNKMSFLQATNSFQPRNLHQHGLDSGKLHQDFRGRLPLLRNWGPVWKWSKYQFILRENMEAETGWAWPMSWTLVAWWANRAWHSSAWEDKGHYRRFLKNIQCWVEVVLSPNSTGMLFNTITYLLFILKKFDDGVGL